MSRLLDRAKALGVAALFVANLFLFALVPDLDIRLLGIDAHRNFLFHSALPVLVLWIGRQWIALRPRRPGARAPDLKGLDLLVCPAAMGLAFHLLVEAVAPGGAVVRFPFRGSLVAAETWDDRAWLAMNGLVAAAVAWRTWTPAFAFDFRTAAAGVLALGRLAVAREPKHPDEIENPTEADAARRIEHAMDAVREEEIDAVGPEGATAREIRAKLDQRVLHVCLVGRVSAGKTALAKALVGETGAEGVAATAGTTRAVAERVWEVDAGEYKLRVVDTPGLEEVDGEGAATLAREAADHADLVVLVVDGDLTRPERAAFDAVAARRRGLVVALSKSDARRDEETRELLASIRERLAGRIDPARVVAVRPRPLARPVAVRLPDGTETLEIRETAPEVGPLREAVLEVAAAEGLSLLARNVFQWAGEVEARIAAQLADLRRDRAEGLLRGHALKSAAAAAVVPSVAADIALAAYIQGKMLREIAAVFGVEFSVDQAKAMTRELTLAAGKLGLVGAATRLAVEAVNLVPLAGFATSAAVQATAAAYATWVAGAAFIDWCAAGARWPEGSAAQAIERSRGRVQAKDLVAELVRRGPAIFGGKERA